MTVIACKDGIIATDSAIWHDGVAHGRVDKIVRLPDGALFAAAGRYAVTLRAERWLAAGAGDADRPAPVEGNDLDAIVLCPDGSVWCIDGHFEMWRSEAVAEAAGSHSQFLYGAMLAGASAEEAVRLAIRYCAHAGGEVQVKGVRG